MIIRIMYDTAVIPPTTVRSIIVMLYKSKGKTNDKNSYRPVSLLRAAMKVLTSIVYEDMDKECTAGTSPRRNAAEGNAAHPEMPSSPRTVPSAGP
jgi:hypothetical protein